MMELSEAMVRYRARENLKQVDAAKLARVSPQTWCSVENGHQHPSKLTEMKIRELVELKEDKV